MPAMTRVGQPRRCFGMSQEVWEGGPPQGTAIPIITNYRKLAQTIAAACGSSGSRGALHAAPSREIISRGCSNTFGAVVRRAGASWCCSLLHWHAMHGSPHRRQNVIRTSRASGASMPALSRVGLRTAAVVPRLPGHLMATHFTPGLSRRACGRNLAGSPRQRDHSVGALRYFPAVPHLDTFLTGFLISLLQGYTLGGPRPADRRSTGGRGVQPSPS